MSRRAFDTLAPIRDALFASLALGLGCTSHEGGTDKEPPIVEPPPPEPPKAGGVCGSADPTGEKATELEDGYVKCADGSINRVAAVAPRPHPSGPLPAPREGSIENACTTDADCPGEGGRCTDGFAMGMPHRYCANECLRDTDCGATQVCVAREALIAEGQEATMNMCAEARCRSAADCPSGECALTSYFNGCHEEIALSCRTPEDQCRTDAQCTNQGEVCAPAGDGPITCEQRVHCVVGRPFLVDGSPRVAPTREGRGWLGSEAPRVDGLNPEQRHALARYWTRIAQMEHASIASFARFTLQLLELGAPPELLAESQRAGLDELEHARIAFAFASAYAEASLGPAAIDLDGALGGDLHDFVDALIDEGCIGESAAAALAGAHAEVIRDRVVRRALHRIAHDETRHAALAWKTLRWLAETQGPWVLARADRRAREALQQLPSTAPALDAVAPPTRRQEEALRREAIEGLVLPLLAGIGRERADRPPTDFGAGLHS